MVRRHTFTANDFVFAFQRLANPQTGADYAEYLTQMNVKNAKQVIRGKLKPESLGIYARDKHTLIMELESPLGYLPDMLAHQATMPLLNMLSRNMALNGRIQKTWFLMAL